MIYWTLIVWCWRNKLTNFCANINKNSNRTVIFEFLVECVSIIWQCMNCLPFVYIVDFTFEGKFDLGYQVRIFEIISHQCFEILLKLFDIFLETVCMVRTFCSLLKLVAFNKLLTCTALDGPVKSLETS